MGLKIVEWVGSGSKLIRPVFYGPSPWVRPMGKNLGPKWVEILRVSKWVKSGSYLFFAQTAFIDIRGLLALTIYLIGTFHTVYEITNNCGGRSMRIYK